MARVPAVVALVINDDLAILQEPAPEREIGVDRKAVAVRQHQPRPMRITMAAHPDARAVRHVEVEHRERRGQV